MLFPDTFAFFWKMRSQFDATCRHIEPSDQFGGRQRIVITVVIDVVRMDIAHNYLHSLQILDTPTNTGPGLVFMPLPVTVIDAN